MVNLTTLKLPNEVMFEHLVRLLENDPKPVIIDPRDGVQAGYPQLLADIRETRQRVYQTLPGDLFDNKGRISKDRPCIGVLTPTSYDFVVAALAILAMGGAIVPLGLRLLPEEAGELLQRSSATGILTSAKYEDLAHAIQAHGSSKGQSLPIMNISIYHGQHSRSKDLNIRAEIDPEMTIPEDTWSAILFTSGTSGPPKGVVHVRKLFNNNPLLQTEPITSLCYQPPHWISGFLLLLSRPLAGHPLVMSSGGCAELWESLRKGGIDGFWAVPTTWEKMKTHYDEVLKLLPAEETEEYLRGMKEVSTFRVTGAFATAQVRQFWRDIFGRPLECGFSSTELAGLGCTYLPGPDDGLGIERCIGEPHPNVSIKFTDGDSGELLVKGKGIFSHYLDNPAATEAAFDEEGYFRTGDSARLVGPNVVLDGRFKTDYIRTKGHRITIFEVESEIMKLPYVSEGYIFGAPDRDGDRLAALIRLEPTALKSRNTPDLRQLRVDLHKNLYAFQLPVALRFLRDGEDVPRTDTGKLIRRHTVAQYFVPNEDFTYGSDVETCDWNEPVADGVKAWDWGGTPY
ncbi:class I adenylate-forming enzyme family protein [Aspergillus melleus]|uniref:class I adenylate-forming enzyme family protein n=1 Tax=Aspergillus melleus TaxID=138277 RepID=UPI001E8E6CE5|nr:uncharacterized protein LDX57_011011 [Aspergillus melleus]KAH8433377.1 hypothetical protein LDX57_011011 [Aspergillus melleus]